MKPVSSVYNHRACFIEALAGFVHVHAHAVIFLARQAAPHPEERSALAKVIQQDDLFRDPNGHIPGKDDSAGAQLDAFGARRHVTQELGVVGTKRIVLEMMLDGPQCVEAEFFRQKPETDLLVIDLAVGYAGVGSVEILKNHLNAELHRNVSPW